MGILEQKLKCVERCKPSKVHEPRQVLSPSCPRFGLQLHNSLTKRNVLSFRLPTFTFSLLDLTHLGYLPSKLLFPLRVSGALHIAMASPRKLAHAHSFLRHKDTDNPPEQLRTVTTDLLKITHPVLLAGMNVAAGPKLAAAVTNAGGLGVIGGVGYTPDMLREQIAEIKSFLKDKNAPFGVDLLIPQVGGNARKTK